MNLTFNPKWYGNKTRTNVNFFCIKKIAMDIIFHKQPWFALLLLGEHGIIVTMQGYCCQFSLEDEVACPEDPES